VRQSRQTDKQPKRRSRGDTTSPRVGRLLVSRV